MQYLNEAIGLLVPGVRFRCMVGVNARGEVVREPLVLDGLNEDARAAVLAAEDGGEHNVQRTAVGCAGLGTHLVRPARQVGSRTGRGRLADDANQADAQPLALHWLRLADPKAERPTDAEIAKQQAAVAGMVAQAAAVRQQLYGTLAKPAVDLLGRSLLTVTAAETRAVERLERYTGQAVRMDGHMRLIEPLPAVEAAALVYPVLLHQDGVWIYGEDNRAAWQAYVDG